MRSVHETMLSQGFFTVRIMATFQLLPLHEISNHLRGLNVQHFVIELLKLGVIQADTLLFEPVSEDDL